MNYLIPLIFGAVLAYIMVSLSKEMGIRPELGPNYILDITIGIATFVGTLMLYKDSNALVAAVSAGVGSCIARLVMKHRHKP